MKLLIAGLTLIVAGFVLAGVTNLNPAIVFIGGFGCTVVALVHNLGSSTGRSGWADPAAGGGGYVSAGDFSAGCDAGGGGGGDCG